VRPDFGPAAAVFLRRGLERDSDDDERDARLPIRFMGLWCEMESIGNSGE